MLVHLYTVKVEFKSLGNGSKFAVTEGNKNSANAGTTVRQRQPVS